MKSKIWGPLTAFALGLVFLVNPMKHASANELEVVAHVDLNRYLGTWYEIARLPNFFQRKCLASTANYSLRDDGAIKVINRCTTGGTDGKMSEVTGKAVVVDTKTNAKLKVQFFWPFKGDYWVIDLGSNYEYSIVSEPRRKFLWILSRDPRMDETVLQNILGQLENKGFDVSRLIFARTNGSI